MKSASLPTNFQNALEVFRGCFYWDLFHTILFIWCFEMLNPCGWDLTVAIFWRQTKKSPWSAALMHEQRRSVGPFGWGVGPFHFRLATVCGASVGGRWRASVHFRLASVHFRRRFAGETCIRNVTETTLKNSENVSWSGRQGNCDVVWWVQNEWLDFWNAWDSTTRVLRVLQYYKKVISSKPTNLTLWLNFLAY